MTGRAKSPKQGLKLRFVLPDGSWLGPGKADLLQGIVETGSISAAGRRLGMSYKRAWGLVEVLNTMFAAPLVASSRGGAGHGGAELTETGQEVLRLFRAMQSHAERAVEAEEAELLRLFDMADKK
ncbi:winged helix-turn-helix domain-containing protein [Albidovulum sediminicola]|uniref:LysR family transcriptional regulator n=1 Tax=Albidovulum sediminicola TaxID=2984331 RepID=A0ABT2Z1C8_9RHOB|nr:LysR family transcriptional regulator [Defluviimonas sp. WL0075]MCV2864906.1 LysR family transcriptional regulator [Defluviimonas sp. WL0075]